MSNPFDYVNSVTSTKNYMIVDTETEKGYSPFMVNRALSYFPDTLLYASDMNRMSNLDNKLQYDYYFYGIRKAKRFAKWAKKSEDDNLELVKTYFGFNNSKALAALKILSEEQLEAIRKTYDTGGVSDGKGSKGSK